MNFACKTISLKDVMCCSFKLNKTEYTVFINLLRQSNGLGIEELGKICDLTKSSIQKSIKSLVKMGFVQRKKINKKKGGYFYSYRIVSKELIKNYLRNNVNGWSQNILKEINKL